ncbi:MAG: ABC1 kinase family protein [Nitrospiraceae bacterium]
MTRANSRFIVLFERATQLCRCGLRLLPLLMSSRRADAPKLLRLTLQELGGAWAKMGQMLALRFDILDEAVCYEFFALLNHMAPFDYEVVRDTIRAELGSDPDELFHSFTHEPFAAASIGQCHRAVLSTGESVVVKIQRPNAKRVLMADVALMYGIACVVDLFGLLGSTSFKELVRTFRNAVTEELDFRNEVKHAEALARNANGHRNEQHAKVFHRYSSQHVLTTAYLDGMPLISLLRKEGREARYSCPDIREICRQLLENTLRQVFQNGYFHADVHPANLIVLGRHQIGYVDYGIVADLSDAVRESLAYYAMHLFLGDIDCSTQEFLRWVSPSPDSDVSMASSEIRTIAADYYVSLIRGGGHVSRNGFASYQIKVLNVARRHDMAISPLIVASFKALITVITIIYQLDPEFPLRRYANRFFSRLVTRETARWLSPSRTIRGLFDLRVRVDRALEAVGAMEQRGRCNCGRSRHRSGRIAARTSVVVFGAICLYEAMGPASVQMLSFIPDSISSPPVFLGIIALCGILLLWDARKDGRHARQRYFSRS